MLQLLLLLASVEFTLNCHAEDIIFGNYSFCHNLSVLASDHLGNKRLEMGKLDFARKQPHQCLQCLSITAVYSISMSSSRKANTPSAKLVFLFAFFFFTCELLHDRSPHKNLWECYGQKTCNMALYEVESVHCFSV